MCTSLSSASKMETAWRQFDSQDPQTRLRGLLQAVDQSVPSQSNLSLHQSFVCCLASAEPGASRFLCRLCVVPPLAHKPPWASQLLCSTALFHANPSFGIAVQRHLRLWLLRGLARQLSPPVGLCGDLRERCHSSVHSCAARSPSSNHERAFISCQQSSAAALGCVAAVTALPALHAFWIEQGSLAAASRAKNLAWQLP